jgi:DNA (cytosine-5)-methyltransferase 1
MPEDGRHDAAGHKQGALFARRPTAVDLFAGAGGLSLGFEQAGFDVVAAVEYDPVHAATHEFNFPRAQVICADIASLTAEALQQAAERGYTAHGHTAALDEIDVLFGGPPCQGFSAIGQRLIDDKRNQLVFHFFRLVSELCPRYFVMENVPGIGRGGHASILAQLVCEFEDAGYRIIQPHQILNAMNFGVPQDRSRLFLIGARADAELPT